MLWRLTMWYNVRMPRATKAHTFSRAEAYARLYLRQHGKCNGCREFFPRLTVDHVAPIALGGSDTPANYQLLCRSCNSRKNATPHAGMQHTVFDTPRYQIAVDRTLTKRQRLTARRRENGLCIACGKPSAPLVTCADCGRRSNEYRKNKKASAS